MGHESFNACTNLSKSCFISILPFHFNRISQFLSKHNYQENDVLNCDINLLNMQMNERCVLMYKNYSYSCYLRFEVKDRPGVLSKITKSLANYQISIKRLLQFPNKKMRTASIIIITHNPK